jgi:hypothetical protein
MLSDLFATAAALMAALAASGPEIGRPLDRLTILIAADRSRSIDLVPGADQRVRQELNVAELGMKEDDRIGTIASARRISFTETFDSPTHRIFPSRWRSASAPTLSSKGTASSGACSW